MAEKLFYSMGEVAELFDVKASLIRHWEANFSILKPQRNKKGNRLFSAQDVENLKLIYHLVREQGMTLEGAKKAMRRGPVESGVERDAELMERLQHIRSLLVEVREDLKADQGELVDEAVTDSGDEPAPRKGRKAVVKIADEEGEEPADNKPAALRKPRRKKEDVETKELFAFYEQKLF